MNNNEPTTRTDPKLRLGEYFIRAIIMRDLVHILMGEFKSIRAMNDEGYLLPFTTYTCFWLSALFVTVEGYRKLRIRDKKISNIIKKHAEELRLLRHNTWHYMVDIEPTTNFIGRDGTMEWAEELHEAFREYLGSYAADLTKSNITLKIEKKET